jgi:hypothetical protein
VPQVGDGVGIQWQQTSSTQFIALKIYARAGGLPDQAPAPAASPSMGVETHATPVPSPSPTSSNRKHGFYGTVTSFTPVTDGQPGSLTARAQETESSGAGLQQTFQVTLHTVFREQTVPQVGDGVAVVWDDGSSDSRVATVVYVRPGGLPAGTAGWQPKPSGSESEQPSELHSTVETRSPPPDGSTPNDVGSASTVETAAGMLVAYIAPLDGEDGLIELHLSRPGTTGEQYVESFLIPAGTQIDLASADRSTPVGTPVALTWVLRGSQRVVLSLAIS